MIVNEYFKDTELACPCGCGLMPSKYAIEKLYALRLMYADTIIINSAARCNEYNYKIGGSKKSYHTNRNDESFPLRPCAFDIRWNNNIKSILEYAMNIGFAGFGFNPGNFLHIDLRLSGAIWTY